MLKDVIIALINSVVPSVLAYFLGHMRGRSTERKSMRPAAGDEESLCDGK